MEKLETIDLKFNLTLRVMPDLTGRDHTNPAYKELFLHFLMGTIVNGLDVVMTTFREEDEMERVMMALALSIANIRLECLGGAADGASTSHTTPTASLAQDQ